MWTFLLLVACAPSLPQTPVGSWPAWPPDAFHGPGERWGGGPNADCALQPPTTRTPHGHFGYSELIFAPDATYAYLPELQLYAEVPMARDPALEARRRADERDGACPTLTLEPFADPRHGAVSTGTHRYVVDRQTGVFRTLDAAGAILESCAMDRRRRHWVCHLDMMWEQTHIDPSGRSSNDAFRPQWQWSGGP